MKKMPKSPYLTSAEAAHRLRLTTQTLANMRHKGHGPRYRKHGRKIIYVKKDIDQWSEQRGQEPTPKTGS